jgi:hypothetical protein
MIYKFKSPATGDLVMLGADGDHMLRLLGREPAARGIIEVDAMDGALQALQDAVAEADQLPADAGHDAIKDAGKDTAADPDDDGGARAPVGLRQRVWPMVEMLRRARAAGQPVVWGV